MNNCYEESGKGHRETPNKNSILRLYNVCETNNISGDTPPQKWAQKQRTKQSYESYANSFLFTNLFLIGA